ncbi:WG repeat-containing protein [Chryseobacterium sp. FH1]|uniref:WG repeat-containing protein n=1 Tax=Chryseobacterium sp. FH1 TaxID=1233951 RepID=UPI0005512A63|nr:WG repeat-containing protein [Chryseobacterium sp. FH1]
MKKYLTIIFTGCFLLGISQMKADLIPNLIPQTIQGKSGYINQKGEIVINPEYHIAMFFSEDCNLLNSPNPKLRIYGSADYATVEKNQISYRINQKGKRIYQYKASDLGKCSLSYESPKYKAFVLNGLYGLVSKEKVDLSSYKDFHIYPQYQMLYVLDSDKENPMLVAVYNDKFGIVDKQNKIIIPFIYSDIKTNLSWKTAHLFEVSKDGKEYFYVDEKNKAY